MKKGKAKPITQNVKSKVSVLTIIIMYARFHDIKHKICKIGAKPVTRSKWLYTLFNTEV